MSTEPYNASLPTYGQILEALDELPAACRTLRRMRGLSVRAAADEIGIAFANIYRFEQRKGGYNSATLRAVLAWLDTDHRRATPDTTGGQQS